MNINKQKVLNFALTLEAGGQKICQSILRSTWKTEYEKSNNTDDNKSTYSSNPMNILKSEKKKKNESLYQVNFHIDCPIISASTLTLHKTKIKQMKPCE